MTGFTGGSAYLADGSRVAFDAVIWATGYRSNYSWLQIPGVVVDGEVRHHGGVTDVPGLCFLGLPWQTCRGSALLGFVGADSATLAARMADDSSPRGQSIAATPASTGAGR